MTETLKMKQCRICLEYKRNLCSVFVRDQGISYADMICRISSIKILKDVSKDSICLYCCGELRRAYDFIEQIERSDMVLNQHLKIISYNNFDDIKAKLNEECVLNEKQTNSDDYNINNYYINSLRNVGDQILYNNTAITKVKSQSKSNFSTNYKHEMHETSNCHYDDNTFYDDLIECDEFIREVKKTEEMQQTTDITLKGAKKETKKCLSKLKRVCIKPIILENIRVIRTKYPIRVRNRKDTYKYRKRKHMCTYCGTMCVNLSSHMMVHIGEKKYKCPDCRQSFFTSKQLSNHQKKHLATNSFKCDHCVAVFDNKTSLQSHMVIHTGDKNHICLVCNKGFKRKCSLVRHALIHNSAARSVKCELCNMSFFYKHALRNHMRVHTGERPYKCEICSQPYSYKHDFNRHCLKKHGVYLKRRSVHIMTEDVLKQERKIMQDLMLRVQGVVKEGELSNPFQGPQAVLAFENIVKALGSSEINAIM